MPQISGDMGLDRVGEGEAPPFVERARGGRDVGVQAGCVGEGEAPPFVERGSAGAERKVWVDV